jgi:hypothetical protein
MKILGIIILNLLKIINKFLTINFNSFKEIIKKNIYKISYNNIICFLFTLFLLFTIIQNIFQILNILIISILNVFNYIDTNFILPLVIINLIIKFYIFKFILKYKTYKWIIKWTFISILILIIYYYYELNIDNYTNSFSMLVLTNKFKIIFKNFIHIFNKGDKPEEENLLRRKRRGRILKDGKGNDIENILDDPTKSEFLWDNHPNGRSFTGDDYHAWKVLQHLKQQGIVDDYDPNDIDNNISNIIENNDIYNKNSPIESKSYRW